MSSSRHAASSNCSTTRRELTPAAGEAEPPGELESALWVTSDTGSPPEDRELSGQGGLGGVVNLNCQRSGMTPPGLVHGCPPITSPRAARSSGGVLSSRAPPVAGSLLG